MKLQYAPRVPEDGVPQTLLPPDTLGKGLAFGFLKFPSSESKVSMGAYGKCLCVFCSFNFLPGSFYCRIPSAASGLPHSADCEQESPAYRLPHHSPPTPTSTFVLSVDIHRCIKLHCNRILSKIKDLNLPGMSMRERRHNI